MKKVHNVCFAYITPFHPERGGIGRVTHSLTLEFQRRGYNVFYLIYPCAITIRHEYDYPAPLEYLPSTNCLSQENINYYLEYLTRNKIDVVINQSGNFSDSALWLKASELGIKVISVLHSTPWISYKHIWYSDIIPLKNDSFIEKLKRIARICLYPKIKKRVHDSRVQHFKQLLPKTDIVCPLSTKFYEELNEIYPGYPDKYYAIPNPNSYDESQINLPLKKQKQILFVGLFGSPKNEFELVKIWRAIYNDYPDWELVMVGDGNRSRVKRLKNLAAGIKNIRFTGFQNPLPYQETASILCVTSIYEGWPMVLTEAMQCGVVPVVYNSFASASEIVEDGVNGMLVTPFSRKEYIEKLRKLIEDDDLRHKMSESARISIKRYNVEQIANQWEQLFDKLFVYEA